MRCEPPGASLRKIVDQRSKDMGEDNNHDPNDLVAACARLVLGAINQHCDPKYSSGQDHQKERYSQCYFHAVPVPSTVYKNCLHGGKSIAADC